MENINCSADPKYFGVVFNLIQNIPDVYSVWRNFNIFLTSVLLNPSYRYNSGGRDPFYGGYYILIEMMFNEQPTIVFKSIKCFKFKNY